MGHRPHFHGSWRAWTEPEWRDEVASLDERLGRFDQDVESFLEDMGDMMRTVVECTVEPLRSFAETLPRGMAFEMKEWRRGWRDRQPHAWRHAWWPHAWWPHGRPARGWR
jgi:hypothetical protein